MNSIIRGTVFGFGFGAGVVCLFISEINNNLIAMAIISGAMIIGGCLFNDRSK